MPPINDVLCLEEIAGKWIRNWLLQSLLRSKSSVESSQIRSFTLKHLNANIRHKLIDSLLDIHIYSLDSSFKFQLLEVLCDASTTCIDLTKGGKIYVEEVFQLFRILAVNDLKLLTRFGINCNTSSLKDQKYIADVNNVFYTPLNQMKHLRWVTLRGVGETLLLQSLGQSCPYLEYLDVRYSRFISDESVINLLVKYPDDITDCSVDEIINYDGPTNLCCSHLSFLGIGGTEANFISVLLSLVLLPKLSSYGGYVDQRAVIMTTDHLESHESHRPLNLTELWEDCLSYEETNTLEILCPLISYLNTSIESIKHFCFLEEIVLTTLILDCDFKNYEVDLLDYLYHRGSQLKCLKLERSINMLVDLESLIEYTPFLNEVKAHVYLGERTKALHKWSNLKTAYITVNSIECLEVFFLKAPELRYLSLNFVPEQYSVGGIDNLNDDFLISVLIQGGLVKLESLNLKECNLGSRGLKALVSHCSNLRSIGKLFYWKKLTPDHFHDLKRKIKMSNWNLELVIKERFGDMTW